MGPIREPLYYYHTIYYTTATILSGKLMPQQTAEESQSMHGGGNIEARGQIKPITCRRKKMVNFGQVTRKC